jgi:hypothetical protein
MCCLNVLEGVVSLDGLRWQVALTKLVCRRRVGHSVSLYMTPKLTFLVRVDVIEGRV